MLPHKPATVHTVSEEKPVENIYQLIDNKPLLFIVALVIITGSAIFLISKFKITWKKFIPTFHSRKDIRNEQEIEQLKKQVSEFEEKLKSYRKFDFFEKTGNGEYIGYAIAKRPYVEFWADGNWSSQDYHIQLDSFERLWDNEDEIIVYGKNPNIPSDLYAVIEKKAKELPSLSIYCSYQTSVFFNKYFSDFENVKIVVRS